MAVAATWIKMRSKTETKAKKKKKANTNMFKLLTLKHSMLSKVHLLLYLDTSISVVYYAIIDVFCCAD